MPISRAACSRKGRRRKPQMDIENVKNAYSAGASQGSRGVSGSGPTGGLHAFDGPAAAVLDHRGAVVRWTGAAEELTGFRAEEVCGRPARELVADLPDDLRDAKIPASGRVRLWHQCGDTIDVTFRTTKVGLRLGGGPRPGGPYTPRRRPRTGRGAPACTLRTEPDHHRCVRHGSHHCADERRAGHSTAVQYSPALG